MRRRVRAPFGPETRTRARLLRVTLLVALACLWWPSSSASAAERVAAVWYPGGSAGVPLLDDLARIRALGFTAIVWPARFADRVSDVRSMADTVDLMLVVEPAGESPARSRLRPLDVSG